MFRKDLAYFWEKFRSKLEFAEKTLELRESLQDSQNVWNISRISKRSRTPPISEKFRELLEVFNVFCRLPRTGYGNSGKFVTAENFRQLCDQNIMNIS